MNHYHGLAILLLAVLTGCFGGSRPAAVVTFYTLEYDPPPLAAMAPSPQSLRVERFSAHRAFDGRGMVYRPSPLVLADYPAARWWVAPAELITDAVIRDLRRAGLFAAVFTFRDADDARFILEGDVEECLELRDRDGAQAALTVRITCRDTGGSPADGIALQKTYVFREKLQNSSPGELAGGMSRALARFSRQLQADLGQALRQAT